jgi:hypothetical protein
LIIFFFLILLILYFLLFLFFNRIFLIFYYLFYLFFREFFIFFFYFFLFFYFYFVFYFIFIFIFIFFYKTENVKGDITPIVSKNKVSNININFTSNEKKLEEVKNDIEIESKKITTGNGLENCSTEQKEMIEQQQKSNKINSYNSKKVFLFPEEIRREYSSTKEISETEWAIKLENQDQMKIKNERRIFFESDLIGDKGNENYKSEVFHLNNFWIYMKLRHSNILFFYVYFLFNFIVYSFIHFYLFIYLFIIFLFSFSFVYLFYIFYFSIIVYSFIHLYLFIYLLFFYFHFYLFIYFYIILYYYLFFILVLLFIYLFLFLFYIILFILFGFSNIFTINKGGDWKMNINLMNDNFILDLQHYFSFQKSMDIRSNSICNNLIAIKSFIDNEYKEKLNNSILFQKIIESFDQIYSIAKKLRITEELSSFSSLCENGKSMDTHKLSLFVSNLKYTLINFYKSKLFDYSYDKLQGLISELKEHKKNYVSCLIVLLDILLFGQRRAVLSNMKVSDFIINCPKYQVEKPKFSLFNDGKF